MSLITAISIGGVCVGVLTMVVTLSVMSGFENELRRRLFAAETHVLIEGRTGYFKNDPTLMTRVRDVSPWIERVYPVLQTEAILRSGKKVSGSVLKGIGTDQMEWLKSQVTEWAPRDLLEAEGQSASRIFLGAEMAFDLGVIPGDYLTLVSPVESEGPLGAVPRLKRFIVEGIYKTNVPEQELHVVFAPIRDVEAFLRQTAVLSQIEVRVDRLEHAPELAQKLQTELGESFSARPWQVLNAHLFQSLRLERTAMFCILVFIVIVATFNIVSTLTMMVLEKKRSLSILRAMGATRDQISSIFLWEGAAIGVLGVFGGIGLGLGICALLAKYPVIELPEVFYDRSLPVLIDPISIAFVGITALGVVLLGASTPAKKAATVTPIQGIREG